LIVFFAGFVLSASLRASLEEMLPPCVFTSFGEWFVVSIQVIVGLCAALVVEIAAWVVRRPKYALLSVLSWALILLPIMVVFATLSELAVVVVEKIVSPWFGHVIIPVADYLVSKHVPHAMVGLIELAMMGPIFLLLWFWQKLWDSPAMVKFGRILGQVVDDLWDLYDEHVVQWVLDRSTTP
jgi:hypothetical protein